MKYVGKGRRVVFDDEELAYIREHFPTDASCDIAENLGVSYPVIIRAAKEMGLKKSEDYSSEKFRFRHVRKYKNNITKYSEV